MLLVTFQYSQDILFTSVFSEKVPECQYKDIIWNQILNINEHLRTKVVHVKLQSCKRLKTKQATEKNKNKKGGLLLVDLQVTNFFIKR